MHDDNLYSINMFKQIKEIMTKIEIKYLFLKSELFFI